VGDIPVWLLEFVAETFGIFSLLQYMLTTCCIHLSCMYVYSANFFSLFNVIVIKGETMLLYRTCLVSYLVSKSIQQYQVECEVVDDYSMVT
jgi:hypothetical protein